MRAVYKFGKTKKVVFISHLDLQRFMQMALRRTDLPAAYSQGFNPHPLMSFASALATGWTSEAELVDIKMASPIDEDFAFSQMKRALPPDIPLLGARLVDDSFPALMAKACLADYDIRFSSVGALKPAVEEFLRRESYMALRKTKSGESMTDIRPMAVSVECAGDDMIKARLMLGEKLTLKPDLLARSLCDIAGQEYPEDLSIHRRGLLTRDENGVAQDLFTYNPQRGSFIDD